MDAHTQVPRFVNPVLVGDAMSAWSTRQREFGWTRRPERGHSSSSGQANCKPSDESAKHASRQRVQAHFAETPAYAFPHAELRDVPRAGAQPADSAGKLAPIAVDDEGRSFNVNARWREPDRRTRRLQSSLGHVASDQREPARADRR
jgi:hypothetical protein